MVDIAHWKAENSLYIFWRHLIDTLSKYIINIDESIFLHFIMPHLVFKTFQIKIPPTGYVDIISYVL